MGNFAQVEQIRVNANAFFARTKIRKSGKRYNFRCYNFFGQIFNKLGHSALIHVNKFVAHDVILVFVWFIGRRGALCIEMGFTWTFPRNQDATVKLKSELISIKF